MEIELVESVPTRSKFKEYSDFVRDMNPGQIAKMSFERFNDMVNCQTLLRKVHKVKTNQRRVKGNPVVFELYITKIA